VRVRRGLLVAGAVVVVAGAAAAAILVRRAGAASPAVSRKAALRDRHGVTPATLALPRRLVPGARWPQAYHVGTLAVSTTNEVLRRATVDVGERRVAAVVIRSDSRTAGPHPGTEHDLAWHAPALGLDLRLQLKRRIGGTFPYTLDADATLLGLTPAR